MRNYLVESVGPVHEFAKAFLNDEIELLFVSFQSMYEDPDELGYMPRKLLW